MDNFWLEMDEVDGVEGKKCRKNSINRNYCRFFRNRWFFLGFCPKTANYFSDFDKK